MKSVVTKWLVPALFLWFFLGPVDRLNASITLAWDPSPDTGISGYNLYYGEAGGATNRLQVGKSTQGTLPNLAAGKTYFVFVTASSSSGVESTPSNQITYTPTAPVIENPPVTDPPVINPPVVEPPKPNTAPKLDSISNQIVQGGSVLSLQLKAADSDVPANALTYSLVSGPSNASVDPATGQFTWTAPQSAGSTTVTVSVTDNGTPALSDSKTFTITIPAPNSAPSLAAIPNTIATIGTELSLQLSASDSDLPAQFLSYAIVSGPAGATIDPVNGVFRWTPGSDQTGIFSATVKVSDNGSPPMSDTKTISILVVGANTAPTFAAVFDQTIAPGNALAVQLTAIDRDEPAQKLSYRLVSGPAGANLDETTGLFTWRPAKNEPSGTNAVMVEVSDSGSPSLSDHRTFLVIVKGSNASPVLNVIPDQTAPEEQLLTISLSATDSDVPAQALTFSLVSGPSGASVSPDGTFRWTPSEGQGPSTNTITIAVTDNGSPALTDSKSFTVFVTESNRAPSLNSIHDVTVSPGQILVFALSGTDSDYPPNKLSYKLVSGPAGAAVDSVTGVFTWRLMKSAVASTNAVTVMVTDDGSPSASDTKSFNVIVLGKTPRNGSSNPRQSTMSTLTWSAKVDGERTVKFTHALPARKLSSDARHYLEASVDLIHWATVGEISDQADLSDESTLNAPHRFYRIRSEEVKVSAERDGVTSALQ